MCALTPSYCFLIHLSGVMVQLSRNTLELDMFYFYYYMPLVSCSYWNLSRLMHFILWVYTVAIFVQLGTYVYV